MQTVASGYFTRMATFGHKIAASRDNTVDIYDSVTGVLGLFLNLLDPAQAICGSPDGSILFCAQESPKITAWDMQTGGLIHTYVTKRKAEDISVSSSGRYLACRLTFESVEVWEVANKTKGTAIWTSSSAFCSCWLEPEERLAVSNGASVDIWDIVAGTVLRSFAIECRARCMVYSHRLNQLAAIATLKPGDSPNSGPWQDAMKIIKLQTNPPTASDWIHVDISCFAFSPTKEELVYGLKRHGLQLLNVSTGISERIEHPGMVKSVSYLKNGVVAANIAGSGIQLLSPHERHAPSQQPIVSAYKVDNFDQGRIIKALSTSHDHILLLETATMSQLFKIRAQGRIPLANFDETDILCASHENLVALSYTRGLPEGYLELWRFHEDVGIWGVQVAGRPKISRISPAAVRLITLHTTDLLSHVYVWNAKSGELDGRLYHVPSPLDIEFTSDTEFCLHYDNHCASYTVSSQGLDLRSRTTHPLLPKRSQQGRHLDVDDTQEWVVSGSKRVCWIPQGYIRLPDPTFSRGDSYWIPREYRPLDPIVYDGDSYCWAGSALVMAGQDGMLRKLAFSWPLEG